MFHILKLAERDELFGEAAFFVQFEVENIDVYVYFDLFKKRKKIQRQPLFN